MFCKRIKMLFMLLMTGVICCTACSGQAEAEPGAANGEKVVGTSEGGFSVMEGSIEVIDDLPDREINVPEYLREATEESFNEQNLDQEKSGDNSTYHLSGEEQSKMASQVAAQIEDSINQVLTDKEYYPNVTGISVNSECTEFNVTFSGRELSLYENVLPMSLCIVGDRFQLYQGKQEDELMTVVNYIDEDSGEIFNTTDSKEMIK